MALSLEIIGEMAEGLGPDMSHVFGKTGGTIGRSDKNDWVLPDQVVSSKHVLVTFKSGEYYIRDASTNGTFVNDPNMTKRRRGRIRLKDGDVLYIGRYEVKVNIYPDLPASCRTFSTKQEESDFGSDSIVISDAAQDALNDLLNTDFVDALAPEKAMISTDNTAEDHHESIKELLINEGIPEFIISPELTEAIDKLVKQTVGNVMNNAFGNAIDDAFQQQVSNKS